MFQLDDHLRPYTNPDTESNRSQHTMTLQRALAFIHELREDSTLRDELEARTSTLDQVAKLAQEKGFDCSIDDIRQAFKHDWGFRRISIRARDDG